MDSLSRNNQFILDIRKKEDYLTSYIEDSVNCEWNQILDLVEKNTLPKDKKIVVVCYSGQTAGQVVAILRLLEYNALALSGGMLNGWLNKEMSTESTCST